MEIVAAALVYNIGGEQSSAEGRWLVKALQRVGAVTARRRDGSGGKLPVGRVLELVYKRFEQQDHEEMRKQIRLGGAFVDPRRPLEADQAFEPFECEFNAPSEMIKCEDIGRREDLVGELLTPNLIDLKKSPITKRQPRRTPLTASISNITIDREEQMLFFVNVRVDPKNLSYDEMWDVWEKETEAAIAARSSGKIVNLWKVAGQRRVPGGC